MDIDRALADRLLAAAGRLARLARRADGPASGRAILAGASPRLVRDSPEAQARAGFR